MAGELSLYEAKIPSPDPTPEQALIALEEGGPAPDPYDEERAEILEALGATQPIDREILFLWEIAGLKQDAIAARLGCSQPSVFARLIRLREWLMRVVPRRLALRRYLGGYVAPPGLEPLDAEIFRRVVWLHEGHSKTGRALGLTQSHVHHRHVVVLRSLPPELRALVPSSPIGWSRVDSRLKFHEAPRAVEPPSVQAPVITAPVCPDVAAILRELARIDADYRWHRGLIALFKSLDPKGPPPGLGIDLGAKHNDIRRLLGKFGRRACETNGWPFEELLSDVYLRIAKSNLGSSPFDPNKSSFGHYVVMQIRATITNKWRHETARGRLTRNVPIIDVDDEEVGLQLGEHVQFDEEMDFERTLAKYQSEHPEMSAAFVAGRSCIDLHRSGGRSKQEIYDARRALRRALIG